MASGLAYGKVAVSGDSNVSAEGVGVFTPTTAGFGASKTNLGFSVGGVEGSYWPPPNSTWKSEYLYLDLGSLNTAESFALAPPGPSLLVPPVTTSFSAMTGTITTHTDFNSTDPINGSASARSRADNQSALPALAYTFRSPRAFRNVGPACFFPFRIWFR
jgi:hypothetical protein